MRNGDRRVGLYVLVYNNLFWMKVNDLKALFEKSGTIKNQPPPGSAYGNTIKPSNLNNKTITTHVE